jgi:hypothetical protein
MRPQIVVKLPSISERGWATLGLYVLAGALLLMAREDPSLWEVDIFKTVFQAVIISGILGMVLSFFYTANKSDEKKADNTAKAFEAITETAKAGQTKGLSDVEPG